MIEAGVLATEDPNGSGLCPRTAGAAGASRSTRALVFLLALAGASSAAAQARTPYLQRGTPSSMHVLWRSTSAQASRVCYGTSPTSLAMAAGSGASELDHDVLISSLTAATRYYYAAAQASCSASTSGDARDTFVTSPVVGVPTPFRLWILGDSGTGDAPQAAVRDAMLAYSATRPPDLFLHMGDIAYTSGTTSEFDTRFFAPYADILRHTPCWPTMGNHEGVSASSTTQTGPYYEAFSLPGDASAGGVASGTEAYYSFDYANAHLVVLDSQDLSRSPSGAMLTWLESDLSANTQDWTLAYFHHPPYTRGTHDSDTESQLVQMRENALPILEAHGVDVVLAGHSHGYERSYLVHGAYDTPTTAGAHVVDPGDGRLDGDGAYAAGAGGTLYVVAGHGGASPGGTLDHPLMFFSEAQNGSCIVDVDDTTLTLTNVRRDGTLSDHVTLMRGGTLPDVDAALGPDTGVARDAGGVALDAAGQDASGLDAGTTPPASGGCGCRASGAPGGVSLGLAGLMVLLLVAQRRPRARSTPSARSGRSHCKTSTPMSSASP